VTIGVRLRTAVVATLLGGLIGGCGLTRVQEPDPGEIPDGPLQAMNDATGPITEVGRGRSLGVGWRYLVYESADGFCTQLDTSGMSGSGCGEALLAADAVFGMVGSVMSDGSTPVVVDGVVSSDVAEVLVTLAGGRRVEATLMSLESAGLDGQAFVAFAPAGAAVEAATAIDDAGEVLEVHDLP